MCHCDDLQNCDGLETQQEQHRPEMILGFCEGVCPVITAVKLTQHLKKKKKDHSDSQT